MKTISKKRVVLSVMVVMFIGCSAGNDGVVMTGADGKSQTGATLPSAIKDPKKFAETNKSPITDPAKYKKDIK